jgi:hypothetical protein
MAGSIPDLKSRIQQSIAGLRYRLSGELSDGPTTDYVAGRLTEFRQGFLGLERMLDELRRHYQVSRREDRDDLSNATSIATVIANRLVRHSIYRAEYDPVLPGAHELPYLATDAGVAGARRMLRNLRNGIRMLPTEV